MCIRDRDYSYSAYKNKPQILGREKEFSQMLEVISKVENNNCLLYTSDAADERSSVDLGGRRIIKKKNKERHGRCGILVTST